MILPERFKTQMRALFEANGMADEEAGFWEGYDKPWHRAWRVNTNRISPEEAAARLAAELGDEKLKAADFLRPVPWAADGYYLPEGARPGLSLLYQQGLIYIQEASAMLPAECLAPKPGELVLDLCAAPGGKSSQILAKLKGKGLLIANDISENRARVLQRNIEQQGLEPCIVLSADPQKDFPASWDGLFDAIQLDAPCSGEGMFRRDPAAAGSWEKYGPDSISAIQKGLLEKAASLLKPGGRLVYSTCTFNLRENEAMLEDFLRRHEDFSLVPAPESVAGTKGVRPGLGGGELGLALRIWPQDGFGEGHFAACLRKAEAEGEAPVVSKACGAPRQPMKKGRGKELLPTQAEAEAALRLFLERNFRDGEAYLEDVLRENRLRVHKNWLYFLPLAAPPLEGVKILKSGTFAGELKRKKDGFALLPAHSWLLELDPSLLKAVYAPAADADAVKTVLSGQTLVLSPEEAERLAAAGADYLCVAPEGFPLAWGKLNGTTIKNLYPAGWVRG